MVTEVEHLLLGKMPIVNTPFVLAETPRQIQVRPQMVFSAFFTTPWFAPEAQVIPADLWTFQVCGQAKD